MNCQEYFAEYSDQITLKEAIRARSPLPRDNGDHHMVPPVLLCKQGVAQQLPLAGQKICLRNKFPRFAPRRELYALHREFGRVVYVGMGGFCFTYFADPLQHGELPREGRLMAGNDQFLDGLPFETMADLVVIPNFAGRYRVRKRCIQFGELNDNQIEELERFILKNAHIPQLAGAPGKRPPAA